LNIATALRERAGGQSVPGRVVRAIASNYLVRRLGKALFTVWFVTTLI
jgi:hypothetical protein